MTSLLDVNLLIARSDIHHQHHALVMAWWQQRVPRKWATCPITELGLLRIYGHPNYPVGPGSPEQVSEFLAQLKRTKGHVFWPDSVSLMLDVETPKFSGVTPKQLTDLYLLALAVRQGGKLATLDTRIDASLVPGGTAALEIVG